MAISKCIKVNNLQGAINYCCKYSKTDYGKYVTTHECNLSNVAGDFERTNILRAKGGNGLKAFIRKRWKVKDYMIIQSFKPNEVSPDTAHEIAIKLAHEYLGYEHQYLVTTHVDKDHIHTHIVFNATKFTDFKSYNSKTAHIVDDLQKANDKLCLEYGLSVITEKKQKGVSQKEYYARKYDRSYKAKLEKIIDNAIANSDTWQEFLQLMEQNCNVKYGKHIAFKQVEQEKFTRAKSLGIDYTEESLKFRIEHKEFECEKAIRFPKFIDKTQAKFNGKENGGLRNWATRQNINALANLADELHNDRLKLFTDINTQLKSLGKEIDDIDTSIGNLTEVLNAQETYKNGYKLIKGLKATKDKSDYKKEHYTELKDWDCAKKILDKSKNIDGKIPTTETLLNRIHELQVERSVLYLDYQNMKREMNTIKQSMLTSNTLQKQSEQGKEL